MRFSPENSRRRPVLASLSRRRFAGASAVALGAVIVSALAAPASAQGLRPGEAFVTRFSGVTSVPGQGGGTLAIDPQGVVGVILDLRSPGRPPDGRHWINEPQRQPARAQDVGQIFGVALDDASPPNVYVTATSAFGLHRTPDNRSWMPGMWGPGGPGGVYRLDAASGYRPQLFARIGLNGRANTGAALGNIAYDRVNRQFFVSDLETGMIHRIGLDGADLGAYDHAARGRTGFMDAEANQRKSLPPIQFPPETRAQIQDCQPLTQGTPFENAPECWNFAPSGRRIWGLGVAQLGASEARLFYAVASGPAFGEEGWKQLSDEEKRNSVWSIGIGPDGAFNEADVRREFTVPDFFTADEDIARAGFSHPVSDIAFPSCGTNRPVMLVAERGGIRNLGLDADNPFATPNESRTIRYELDGSGAWIPIGRYDVGFYDRQREGPPYMRANCAGGAAFGLGYNESNWRVNAGRPDQFVWITGDALCSPDGPCNGANPLGVRSPQPAAQGAPASEEGDDSEVHGVQGTPEAAFDELVPGQGAAVDGSQPGPGGQPQGAPVGAQGPPPAVGPSQSYLVDVDVNVDAAGAPIPEELSRNDGTMVGDIAIYQLCAPAPGRPVYMIPPPVRAAPPAAWPAFGEVHAPGISHARYASHGRQLSHFRFGSHSLDISHHRWQSHWPRISHDRARSHYRWYSLSHVRPLSPGHDRRISPGHRRPLSPGHRRGLSPGHVRPLSPGHNRFSSPGHVRPLSPGHSRAVSPGHRRPASPGHSRILSPGGHQRALSLGPTHRRGASPAHVRAASVTQQPVAPGHRRGLSPGTLHPRATSARPVHDSAASRRTVRPVGPPPRTRARPLGPRYTGPRRPGPGRVGPADTGPRRFGPGPVGPRRYEPVGPGPRRFGPSPAGPRRYDPVGPGPRRFGPGPVGPRRYGPGPSGPGHIGPGPGRAGPARIGPTHVGPQRRGPYRGRDSDRGRRY